MWASTLSLGWYLPLILVLGVAAGISNGVAGGGTFITFPAMLAFGIAPLAANVSTSVGVYPSYVGGMWHFRAQITPHRRLLVALLAPCGLGAAIDCALLFALPASAFRNLGFCCSPSCPWLCRSNRPKCRACVASYRQSSIFFAAIIFVIRGHLVLWAVFALLFGTLVGGWVGTWLISRLSPRTVRGLIVGIGLFTTIRLN